MEATQSFRLAGNTDILEIPCDQDDDQIVVYWDDILEAFPDVQYIKNGNTFEQIVRIKHHPGVILDIVPSTPIQVASEPVESSMLASKLNDRTNNAAETVPDPIAHVDVINDPQMSTLASRVHVSAQDVTSVASAPASGPQRSSANLSLKEVVAFSTSKYHLVPSLLIGIHTQISESSTCLQELTDQMDKNNELASKNNELVSQVKGLIHTNNKMASRTSELTLNITEITSSNMESTGAGDQVTGVIQCQTGRDERTPDSGAQSTSLTSESRPDSYDSD
ncbi:hypothetical protein BGX31_011696, partial [Mortierella sp. GBA43]